MISKSAQEIFDELLQQRAKLLEEEFARMGRELTDEEKRRFGLIVQQEQQEQQTQRTRK
jgi:hypothetical protein